MNSVVVSSSTFAYTISNLVTGVYYDISVQARNVVGDSLKSTATRIVAANAPNAPLNV